MIDRCEAEAARLGLGLVELYANEKMTADLSPYPRLGYAETDRREEDGFKRVYFRKRAPGSSSSGGAEGGRSRPPPHAIDRAARQ